MTLRARTGRAIAGYVALALILFALVPPWETRAQEANGSDAQVVISKAECRNLVRHVPSADVEYQPGVDVHGKPVKPADLEPSRIKLPDEITIDITVEVFEFLERDPPRGLGESAAKIGTVVLKNGVVTFNGEALTTEEEAAVVAVCRELLKN